MVKTAVEVKSDDDSDSGDELSYGGDRSVSGRGDNLMLLMMVVFVEDTYAGGE